MPFITIPVAHQGVQLSFDDILFGISDADFEQRNQDTKDTRTVYRERIPERLSECYHIDKMIAALRSFCDRFKDIIEAEDKSSYYRSFKIPKHSGGFRQIDAPNEEMKNASRQLKDIFQYTMRGLYHTSAFAYIDGRSTLDALRRHQKNNSKWFAKLDFHNFFGSTTPDFVMSQLSMIFPFSEIVKDAEGEELLAKALSIAYLNGGLPQGAPLSPYLTNIMMIPFDHAFSRKCHKHCPRLIYTRYADDIMLSSDLRFNVGEVVNLVKETLAELHAPFMLNEKKTRFGSSSGANWWLGLMLNENNDITIGSRRKNFFKVSLYNLIQDVKKGVEWSVQDLQHLQGVMNYYKQIEPKAIQQIVDSYSRKFGVNIESVLKLRLSAVV